MVTEIHRFLLCYLEFCLLLLCVVCVCTPPRHRCNIFISIMLHFKIRRRLEENVRGACIHIQSTFVWHPSKMDYAIKSMYAFWHISNEPAEHANPRIFQIVIDKDPVSFIVFFLGGPLLLYLHNELDKHSICFFSQIFPTDITIALTIESIAWWRGLTVAQMVVAKSIDKHDVNEVLVWWCATVMVV